MESEHGCAAPGSMAGEAGDDRPNQSLPAMQAAAVAASFGRAADHRPSIHGSGPVGILADHAFEPPGGQAMFRIRLDAIAPRIAPSARSAGGDFPLVGARQSDTGPFEKPVSAIPRKPPQPTN